MRSATRFAPEKLFTSRTFPLVLATLLSTASGLYYATGARADNDSAQQAAPAAPNVEVTELTPTEIRTWTRFSGRLTPVASAEIKPLVGGTIQQVLFEDGQLVHEGDPLFVIDPRTMRRSCNGRKRNSPPRGRESASPGTNWSGRASFSKKN